jgi:hypothetical protein
MNKPTMSLNAAQMKRWGIERAKDDDDLTKRYPHQTGNGNIVWVSIPTSDREEV